MLRVILLCNLSAAHIRTLLAVEGIDVDLLDQVMALTYGHSSDAAEVSELWDWLRGPTFMEEAHRNPPA